ncbi:MAG: S-layer homology domain-containing protein [Bacillota bacterium]|jgi:uncharacterized repeat protein (TIGR02543 family)
MVLKRRMLSMAAIATALILVLAVLLTPASAYAKGYTIENGQDISKFDVSQLETGDTLALIGEINGKLVVPETVKSLNIRPSTNGDDYGYWNGQIEMQAADAVLNITDVNFVNYDAISLLDEASDEGIQESINNQQCSSIKFSANSGVSVVNFKGEFIHLSAGLANYAIEAAANLEVNILADTAVFNNLPFFNVCNGISTAGDLDLVLSKESLALFLGPQTYDIADGNVIRCLGDLYIEIPKSSEGTGLYIVGGTSKFGSGNAIYAAQDIEANVDGHMLVVAGAKLDESSGVNGKAIICDGIFTVSGTPQTFLAATYYELFEESELNNLPLAGGLAIEMTNGTDKFVNETNKTKMRGEVNKTKSVEIVPENKNFLTYIVRFDSQGGTPPVYYIDPGNDGTVTEPAEPTRDGFVFCGWYTDKLCKKPYDFAAEVTEKTTLYAKWSIDPETLPHKDSIKFKDVKDPNKWLYTPIMNMVQNGYMNGTAANVFSPHANLTRGMLVTILWRMEGSPVRTFYGANYEGFDDVNAVKYYYNAVNWAADCGIVNGQSEYKFSPDQSIKRQDIALILYRYMGLKGYKTESSGNFTGFKDAAKISGYAKNAMSWAIDRGIINGDNNYLKPISPATRAETTKMLWVNFD